MKNIGIIIHTREGLQTYKVSCEEHLPIAVRAIFGEEVGGPFAEQEPTGEVIEVDEPCPICMVMQRLGYNPLDPITVRPKHKIRQNIRTD